MRIYLIYIAILLLLPGCAARHNFRDGPFYLNKWVIVWEENFSGGVLNNDVWSRVVAGSSDWNRNMSSDADLLRVADGALSLWAKYKNDSNNVNFYSTAGVTSKTKFSFKYGKIEVRARTGSARGAWPAIWMMGVDGVWPANGEIDLMEHLNFDKFVYQTIHSPYTIAVKNTGYISHYKYSVDVGDWNIYGCEWFEDEIVFTINGVRTGVHKKEPYGSIYWPFDSPFYIILSMQVGGGWVNSREATVSEDYPVVMDIDWIRVYSKIN